MNQCIYIYIYRRWLRASMSREGTLLSTITYSSTGWSKMWKEDNSGALGKEMSLPDDTSPGKIFHGGGGNNSIGDKIINFTYKIFKVLIVSAITEIDPLILIEILDTAKFLLEEIPLLSLSTVTGTRIKCLVDFEILAMRFFKVIDAYINFIVVTVILLQIQNPIFMCLCLYVCMYVCMYYVGGYDSVFGYPRW